MTKASREEERREARQTDANTDAFRDMALDTLCINNSACCYMLGTTINLTVSTRERL